jgi:hypothetical protein
MNSNRWSSDNIVARVCEDVSNFIEKKITLEECINGNKVLVKLPLREETSFNDFIFACTWDAQVDDQRTTFHTSQSDILPTQEGYQQLEDTPQNGSTEMGKHFVYVLAIVLSCSWRDDEVMFVCQLMTR